MFNVSEYVSAKTGSVVFVRKDGNFYCSESYHEAHKKIFKTRATIEYIDLDKNYNTTRVDASVDETKKIITLQVPAEFGSANMLRVTYSCGGNLAGEEIGAIGGGSGAGSYVVRLPADTPNEFNASTMCLTIYSAESYDNFAQILYNGGTVSIDISSVETSLGTFPFAMVIPGLWLYNDVGLVSQHRAHFGDQTFTVAIAFTNGTWTPPTA